MNMSFGLGLAVVSACLAVAVPLPLAAQGTESPSPLVEAPHVRVELIGDGAVPAPGRSTWLGLRFVLEPGWHLYWQNPGESGSPPTVRWTLPTNVVAGPILWPVPSRIVAGESVNFGYEGEVVLPIALSASAVPPSDGKVSAQARWVICRDVCVSGRADLQLALGGDRGAAARSAASLIGAARARVPVAAPASWKVRGQSVERGFVVSVETGRSESGAVFFPSVAGQVQESAPVKATPTSQGVRFELRRSEYLNGSIPSLHGVVVLADGRAFQVEAPLAHEQE